MLIRFSIAPDCSASLPAFLSRSLSRVLFPAKRMIDSLSLNRCSLGLTWSYLAIVAMMIDQHVEINIQTSVCSLLLLFHPQAVEQLWCGRVFQSRHPGSPCGWCAVEPSSLLVDSGTPGWVGLLQEGIILLRYG